MANPFGRLTRWEMLLVVAAAAGLVYLLASYPLDPVVFEYQEI